METRRLTTTIGPDGQIHIDLPSKLPPGPADVVVVINPVPAPAARLHWRDCYGLGKEVWAGEDAQAYVDRLRDEWA